MPTLTVLSGQRAGVYFELNRREMVIGRDPTCQMIIASRTVSRNHATITETADGWRLEDKSTNGTFLNGKRLSDFEILKHKDRIRIHNIVLGFHEGPPEAGLEVFGDQDRSETIALDADDSSSHIIASIDVMSDHPTLYAGNAKEKLRAIIDITKSVGSILNVDQILTNILDSLFRSFPNAEHGHILQAVDNDLYPWAVKHRDEDEKSGASTLGPMGHQIVNEVLKDRKAFLTRNAADDIRLKTLKDSIHGDNMLRSAICAPLIGSSKKMYGVILLESVDPDHTFEESDLDVLVSAALLGAQAIANVENHEALVDLARREYELETAKRLQLSLLPSDLPEIDGYQFAVHYKAADAVAGDYYDFVQLPNGTLAICAGDVAGKGVAAAMVMARLFSDTRYCLLTTSSPSEAMSRLNQIWKRGLPQGPFVTALMVVLDPATNIATVVNAGHMPPFLRRGSTGEVVEMAEDCAALPVGVLSEMDYPQREVPLNVGDAVALYTDGISEAMNHLQEAYGIARLRDAVARCDENVALMSKIIVKDVRDYAQGARQSDDICLVAFSRRTSAASESEK